MQTGEFDVIDNKFKLVLFKIQLKKLNIVGNKNYCCIRKIFFIVFISIYFYKN